ncbi:MAG: hypothetical protein ACOYEV_00200 [Candidatus Nanopelagicales bacterium]
MSTARQALARLLASPAEVAANCRRFEVDVLTAFGSAIREDADPQDLDIAARRLTGRLDMLGLLDALSMLSGYDGIDLLDLRSASPLAADQALDNVVMLYESTPGRCSEAAVAAAMMRMDTGMAAKPRPAGAGGAGVSVNAALVAARLAMIRELLADLESFDDVTAGN